MLRERRADYGGATRDYLRAHRNDPSYPVPPELTDAMVEASVLEAVRSLHPSIQAFLGQVPLVLEEVPEQELLASFDPPASPSDLLGYFSGPVLSERSMGDPWSAMPGSIVLYRRNIARIAVDRPQMLEELRITIFHEVGHALGLSEEDLEQRGLD
jgi:predicted Zn-dependent protease with MMP-like domain